MTTSSRQLLQLPETLQAQPMNKVTIGLDLQPDGLTATLAGHCQLTKNIHGLRKLSDLYVCFERNKVTSSALISSK